MEIVSRAERDARSRGYGMMQKDVSSDEAKRAIDILRKPTLMQQMNEKTKENAND